MNASENLDSLTQVNRRDFLAAGSAGVVGFSLCSALAAQPNTNSAVIQIVLNGGASHLETFDPKPQAPREIRGPLRSIATHIPSVRFAECLPGLAQRADKLVVLRSLFHEFAPIHETGLQLLQAGQVSSLKEPAVPFGLSLQEGKSSKQRFSGAIEIGGNRTSSTAPFPLKTRIPAWIDPGTSNPEWNGNLPAKSRLPDFHSAGASATAAYGSSEFGRRFWTAMRLVEQGAKYVLVHTFDNIEGSRTWDAHGDPDIAPATLFDYRDSIGPQFDRALSALLDELQQTGLWSQTLVVCAGEFGRTPRVNENGGRDHWPHCWSGLLSGGMLEGGRVVGETDPHGEGIIADPLPVAQLANMAREFIGLPLSVA